MRGTAPLGDSGLFKSYLNIQEGQKIQEIKTERGRCGLFMHHSSFMCLLAGR